MKKICLIEDNPGDSLLVEEMLKDDKRETYSFARFIRLSEAMQSEEAENSDIVLLDLNLPDSSGLETFLKFHANLPQLPVILLTGLQDETTAISSLQQGAQDYLVKGQFSSSLLSKAIRYAIERKSGEIALRESEERYALATRGANDGLWDWDLKNNTIFFSDRWVSMAGYEKGTLNDTPEQWFSLVHPEDRKELEEKLNVFLIGDGNRVEHEYRMCHRDGSDRWMYVRAVALRDDTGEAYRMAGSLTDITDRKEIETQLVKHSLSDLLTGLANKALFIDRISNAIHKSTKNRDYGFAFLLMDCDAFKLINSNYTYKTGDALLKAIAGRLRHVFRPIDTFARYGGDEFGVLLENIGDASNILPVVERIRLVLEPSFSISAKKMYASVSVGIVIGDGDYRDPSEVFRDADIAMYRAKSFGRSGFEFFSGVMRDKITRKMDFEARIQNAVKKGELCVYYQPIIAIDEKAAIGFEALVRWDDPTDGVRLPGEFLPQAEEAGSIVMIDEWLIDEVCRQIHQWQLLKSAPVVVSINLSPQNFKDKITIVDSIAAALEYHKLDAANLRVEITESALMENYENAHHVLTELQCIGVKIGLDDFGTGMSSLSSLHSFPVDGVKIDRSFIRTMATDPGSEKIILTIISLAHDLDLEVIAEGVETIGQREFLAENNCEYAQGYHYAKPMPADEAEKIIDELSVPRKVR